jgi:hypothetical protein
MIESARLIQSALRLNCAAINCGEQPRREKYRVPREIVSMCGFARARKKAHGFPVAGILIIENSSSTETRGKFLSYLACWVLRFPVLAIAAKHSFSLAAMCSTKPTANICP